MHWSGRRFYSGRAKSGPEQRLSSRHSWSHYLAGRTAAILLPERALLRIVSCTCLPLKWRAPRCRRPKCQRITAKVWRVPPIIVSKCKAREGERRRELLRSAVARLSRTISTTSNRPNIWIIQQLQPGQPAPRIRFAFLRIDRINGPAKILARARFHFDENERIAIATDDIDFTASRARKLR